LPFAIWSYKVTAHPRSSALTVPMVANPPAAPTRVAVVAVHGVGHHQTGASSDAIANLRMNTLAAVQWVFKNVQSDARVFGVALVVEHRYARDLAVGIVADGLAVR
jgi:hypothetical protein